MLGKELSKLTAKKKHCKFRDLLPQSARIVLQKLARKVRGLCVPSKQSLHVGWHFKGCYIKCVNLVFFGQPCTSLWKNLQISCKTNDESSKFFQFQVTILLWNLYLAYFDYKKIFGNFNARKMVFHNDLIFECKINMLANSIMFLTNSRQKTLIRKSYDSYDSSKLFTL